jgi:hypothetical protein
VTGKIEIIPAVLLKELPHRREAETVKIVIIVHTKPKVFNAARLIYVVAVKIKLFIVGKEQKHK